MINRLILLAALLSPSLAFGQTYWGDYQDANQTEYMYFPTSDDTGARATLGSGALACYENGSATQFTSGLTLDNDFDSVTGLHQIAVDLNDANFETGKTYTVVLTAGTVDGVSVVGAPLVTFSVGRYASSTDINDDLLNKTLSAPTGPSGATPTVGDALSFMNWVAQARIVTTDILKTIYGADGTTAISEEAIDGSTPGTIDKDAAGAP